MKISSSVGPNASERGVTEFMTDPSCGSAEGTDRTKDLNRTKGGQVMGGKGGSKCVDAVGNMVYRKEKLH